MPTNDEFDCNVTLNDTDFLKSQIVNNDFDNKNVYTSHNSKTSLTNIFHKNNTVNDNISSQNLSNETILNLDTSLSSWGLPEGVLMKYREKGITDMFMWQVECLGNKKVLEFRNNLVYSAPTSAGKTLVAEILALKTLLEKQKKVIIILPFVSVVREKMFYFQDILSLSGIRVEGFMGSHSPPGGFKAVQLAICTIEKANSIVNKLLDDGTLSDIGAVIIDEMHLLGDPSRGYLLELLLTKLRYMSTRNKDINIQLIGMSATLPNLDLLSKWLTAELYTTTFRPIPLQEFSLLSGEIFDTEFKLYRKLQLSPDLTEDTDNILQLCLETISKSCSVLIFCPTKNWCENLAQQISVAFFKLGRSKSKLGLCLREQLDGNAIAEILEQLKRCPVGLDSILKKTVSFGVAFHHAGLTMDERDIIEGAFRTNALRVLVATSTLSSGVNLPAQRVIIRTPMFHGKPLDSLTYRQMIGRAGRMGKDTSGESILVCQKTDKRIAGELMAAKLQPIESCLEGAGKLKRAILEVIASRVAVTPEDVKLFTNCTLLAASVNGDLGENNPIDKSVEFLVNNEFIRLQKNEEGELRYVATNLAKACLSSSLPPEDGLALFEEIEKARQCFVLDSDLHLLYLVTPYSVCSQWTNLDWMTYLNFWEKLTPSMKRVADLVGVQESFIFNATRGRINTSTSKQYHRLQIHRRFYTALALQDLVNEVPLNLVANKFQCSRGMLQSLQQSASMFAGMVTSFCSQLGWKCIEILISQFQDRLQFGIQHELLDLMKLPNLNGPRARALYNAGIETLTDLAAFDVCKLENILLSSVPFESEKERDGETAYDVEQKKKIRGIFITGKQGLTAREAASMLIKDARKYLQLEIGAAVLKWDNTENVKSKNDSDNESSACNSSVSSLSMDNEIFEHEDINKNENNNHNENKGNNKNTPVTTEEIAKIIKNKKDKIISKYNSNILQPESITNIGNKNTPAKINNEIKKINENKTNQIISNRNSNILKSESYQHNSNNANIENKNTPVKTNNEIRKISENKTDQIISNSNILKSESYKINSNIVNIENKNTPVKTNNKNGKMKENKTHIIISNNNSNVLKFETNQHINNCSNIENKNTPVKINNKINNASYKINNTNEFLKNNVKDETNIKIVVSGEHKNSSSVDISDNLISEIEDVDSTNASLSFMEISNAESNFMDANLNISDLESENENEKKASEENNDANEQLNSEIFSEDVFTDWTPIECEIPSFSLNISRKSQEIKRLSIELNKSDISGKSGSLFDESINLDSKLCDALDISLQASFKPSQIKMEDTSFFDNIPNSFNAEEKSPDIFNKSDKEDDVSDVVETSQSDIKDCTMSSLYNSAKKLHTPRKRNRKSVSENCVDLFDGATPTKRQRIDNNKEGNNSKNNEPIDLTSIDIIDVCKNINLFETFCREIKTMSKISFAVACEYKKQERPLIGQNIVNSPRSKLVNSRVNEICVDNKLITGVAFSYGNNTAYYISFDNEKCVSNTNKILFIKELFQIELKVRIFEFKEQAKLLYKFCNAIIKCTVQDPKMIDWMLEPEEKEKNLTAMALKYTPEAVGISQLAGNCKGVGSIALDVNNAIVGKIRACVEAVVTFHVVESQIDILAEQNNMLLKTFEIEMKSVNCLAKMELIGLCVDKNKMNTLITTVQEQMAVLQQQAFSYAGRHFSFTSTKDVAKVLGIYKGKRVSTNKQTLEQSENPISKLILQWRKLNCTLTKVMYPILRSLNNDRIHGCCVTHTSTGRISMHEPNLQNIPRNFDIVKLDKTIIHLSARGSFVPSEGKIFLSADYCQLELRLLAHMSQDSVLCNIMRSKEDVFKSIAAKLNKISENEVTDVLRQRAKQLCYGILYGMGAKALSEQLNSTEDEAVEFSLKFKNTYPKIQQFIQNIVDQCKEQGYVETLAGRRRYLPHIDSNNAATKSQAERQAVNSTIQGSAADIAKNAMVKIDQQLCKKFPGEIPGESQVSLVLHLHDELLYEVPTSDLRSVALTVKNNMENSVNLSIPFPVKLRSGYSWGELEEFNI